MRLEEYFDFKAENDIRLKGHRIGIESVLYEYIHRSQTPEEIADRYPTLTLEQIYATILYYLRNKERIHDYMVQWIEHEDRMYADQAEDSTPAVDRVRNTKAGRKAEQTQSSLKKNEQTQISA
jgi:uncharacterized protein (DUF433 family)